MPLGQHNEAPEPTVDQAVAEQVLLVAARLQHGHKERFSLSELKQVAAEADIRSEFVDEALLLLQQKEVVRPVVRVDDSRVLVWLGNVAVGFLIGVAQYFAMMAARGSLSESMPKWVAVAAGVCLLGYYVPNGRRWPQVLAVSALVSTVVTLLLLGQVHWFDLHRGFWEHLCLLIALEVLGFTSVQKFAERSKGVSVPSMSVASDMSR